MSTRAANLAAGNPSGNGAGSKRQATAPPPVDDEDQRYDGTIVESRDNGSGAVKYRATKKYEKEGRKLQKRLWAKVTFHVSQCLADGDGTAWATGYKAVVGQKVAFDVRRGRDGRKYAADITSHPDDGPVVCVPVARAMAD